MEVDQGHGVFLIPTMLIVPKCIPLFQKYGNNFQEIKFIRAGARRQLEMNKISALPAQNLYVL